MKKYFYLGLGIVLLVLIFTVVILSKQIDTLNSTVKTYDNNFKALNLEYVNAKESVMAYKFSTEQLEYINDSIITELNNTRKELNIKDKELKQLQKIKTETHIKDSIFFKDTIFKKEFVKIDTLINNDWYSTKITLEYPSKISLDLSYMSDLSVIASTKKEIIGTPKKCWLGRLFQKKQNVIRVDVKDNNPYSEIKSKKFVIVE